MKYQKVQKNITALKQTLLDKTVMVRDLKKKVQQYEKRAGKKSVIIASKLVFFTQKNKYLYLKYTHAIWKIRFSLKYLVINDISR